MSTPFLEDYFAFLRFQSVSTEPALAPQVAACAEWLERKFRAMGLEARVYPTAGHPIVVARSTPKPGRRTLLIYGHYDVQPADPLEEWHTPPFEPTVRDGLVYARGATDNKGQLLAHILGVEKTLRERGELPVNIIFLAEGEEESGSEHLAAFLEAHREELRCDLIAISDTGMVARGLPSLTYGLRGILAMEVRLHGAETDLHSGLYGGVAPNPATLLARMLATLHDADFRVAIPGFYDDVAPLQAWERKEWARLPLDEAFFKEAIHSQALLGEGGYTPVERAWGRPTAEINGIGGGYQGSGSKTVIPREAFAKLSFRLVPNQKPAQIEACVRAHLERVCPPQVRMEILTGHGGQPFLCDPNGPDGLAARRALVRTWGVEPALIREGGSIPILEALRGTLGVEILLLGMALPDCACHAPNESFPLENFEAGMRLNQALLEELARA
ncbi:MAG: dipeptidase [Chthoniobacteraceae bacterium]|nr:dipeptidase [Chthoniobacteraceae bacterium]